MEDGIKVAIFTKNDRAQLENFLNKFLEDFIWNRIIDIKFTDGNEYYTAVVIYKT
jgi:hypothetical protein